MKVILKLDEPITELVYDMDEKIVLAVKSIENGVLRFSINKRISTISDSDNATLAWSNSQYKIIKCAKQGLFKDYENIKTLAEFRASGKTWKEIAEFFGISVSTCWKAYSSCVRESNEDAQLEVKRCD